jgi:hypothetical protein
MRELISKATPVFVVLFIVYVLSYASGYLAGKMKWTDVQSLRENPVLKFSSTLEYKVPGYSHLLKAYKGWHDRTRLGYLFQKNAWGLGTLFFINNFFVANLTMFLRALFVLPITLVVFGKFFQGVVFAQTPAGGRIVSIFLLEFGGYFLTIGATLSLVFWTLLPRTFRFESRRKAFVSGLKLLGFAYLLSGAAILLGSILETRFILRFFGGNS